MDSARGNYVYGKVLLRPVQAGSAGYEQHQERPNPLGTLRELANEQQMNGEQADEEFEGEFHSGPLRQVEVRQLRSLDQQMPLVELVTNTTTADTNGRIV